MKNHLKKARSVKEFTQQELADLAGVSRQTIHSIESGRYIPSTELALKFARILDVSVEQLFELEEED